MAAAVISAYKLIIYNSGLNKYVIIDVFLIETVPSYGI
jgi:hypothetical protein